MPERHEIFNFKRIMPNGLTFNIGSPMLYIMKKFTGQVSAKVRSEMAAQKKSRIEMCLFTGIASSTMARRLAGASPFTTDEIAAVAKFLGVAPSYLLDVPAAKPSVSQEVQE
jgi:hypothetical protein